MCEWKLLLELNQMVQLKTLQMKKFQVEPADAAYKIWPFAYSDLTGDCNSHADLHMHTHSSTCIILTCSSRFPHACSPTDTKRPPVDTCTHFTSCPLINSCPQVLARSTATLSPLSASSGSASLLLKDESKQKVSMKHGVGCEVIKNQQP